MAAPPGARRRSGIRCRVVNALAVGDIDYARGIDIADVD